MREHVRGLHMSCVPKLAFCFFYCCCTMVLLNAFWWFSVTSLGNPSAYSVNNRHSHAGQDDWKFSDASNEVSEVSGAAG